MDNRRIKNTMGVYRMDKRMKKIMIIFIIVFAAFFIGIFGMLFSMLDKVEKADYYNLSGDKISTFTKVTGYGKIRESQSSSTPDVEQKKYTYSKVPEPSQNISAYQQYLKENDGFIEMNFDGMKMSGGAAILVKESIEQGKLLTVQVLSVPRGVEITLQKIPGELTEN